MKHRTANAKVAKFRRRRRRTAATSAARRRCVNLRLALGSVALAVAALALASGLVLGDLMDIRRPTAIGGDPAAGHAAESERPLVRVGVVSRFAPNLIYAGYQPIIDYLNAHGTHHYELRPSTDYRDAVERLRSGDVTASFLGAWILRQLGPAAGLEPLLGPLNADGQSRFHDVLIVPEESGIQGIADLAGRRVAVPSRDSWAGNWLQAEALPAAGLTPADLDTLQHFDHHQTVVWRVLHGDFDAGVVKEAVATRYRAEGLRVAAVSATIPGPPLVVRAGDDGSAVEEIRRLLLALDPGDARDARTLAAWTAEFAGGFGAVGWCDYGPAADGAGTR
jgi:phosphonate transport system substrate-binding protein